MIHKQLIIIGGGLGGLSLSILLARAGWQVTVLEKGTYPRQKVCGEYISKESAPFLSRLGIDLVKAGAVSIDTFELTNPISKPITTKLQKGAWGISRYTLDAMLYEKALEVGVCVETGVKVSQVECLAGGGYSVRTSTGTLYNTPWLVGGFGRISGLQPNRNKGRFFGVKYHVESGPKPNRIEIHVFSGGYCGVSAVGEGAYNLCFIGRSSDLKLCKGDLDTYMKEFMYGNPWLKERLESKKRFDPIKTAKIDMGVQSAMSLGYPLLGDAAGFIPPLTGNGMSLAFRSAQVLYTSIRELENSRLPDNITLLKANQAYIQNYVAKRIRRGIFLQNVLFSDSRIAFPIVFPLLKHTPGLFSALTQQAVGADF